MAKPNPLAQGLNRAQGAAAVAKVPTSAIVQDLAPAARKAVAPSRAGRVLIGGHFAPEVQTALKIVAAEERTTVQALLADAIDVILAKHGKPQIAKLSTN